MISKGYVGLFKEPLEEAQIREIISVWLSNFDLVEQVYPGPQAGTATFTVKTTDDIAWDAHMQFRVHAGGDFCWVYLSKGRRVLETTGLPDVENTIPLYALLELPGLEEVIAQENERRLDQLEAEGLL